MKILVIDDKKENIESAKKTLAGHELTFITSHDEAISKMFPKSVTWEKKSLENDYDLMIADLLMPVGKFMQSEIEHVGEEMPVGFHLILMGSMLNIPKILLCTDMGHHSHPASAWLDCIGKIKMKKSTVYFDNNPSFIEIDGKKAKHFEKILISNSIMKGPVKFKTPEDYIEENVIPDDIYGK